MPAPRLPSRAALCAALLAVVCACAAACTAANTRPVVGVLTLPCDPSHAFCQGSSSYLAASYVKWLEGGGAQVVPLHHEMEAAELRALAGQLNGVLFTGGGASLAQGAPYQLAAQALYDAVAELNAAGKYVPLWGTCMGFEMVLVAQTRNSSILNSGYNAENLTLPLNLTGAAKGSRIFQAGRAGAVTALEILSSQPVTMNNHHQGIDPARFAATPALADHFRVLATNEDRDGRPFVSLIENADGYVFASQFHPEKNIYEWDPNEVMQHTGSAVLSMQYLAETFVDYTRASSAAFDSPQALKEALIYNSAPRYSGDVSSFTQCYYWNYTAPAA